MSSNGDDARQPRKRSSSASEPSPDVAETRKKTTRFAGVVDGEDKVSKVKGKEVEEVAASTRSATRPTRARTAAALVRRPSVKTLAGGDGVGPFKAVLKQASSRRVLSSAESAEPEVRIMTMEEVDVTAPGKRRRSSARPTLVQETQELSLLFGGGFGGLSPAAAKQLLLKLRMVSWKLFLVPLVLVFLWLTIPLNETACEDKRLQHLGVFVFVIRPFYMAISVLMCITVMRLVLKLPSVRMRYFVGFLCVVLDTIIGATLLQDQVRAGASRLKLRVIAYSSVVVSITPLLVAVVYYINRRDRKRKRREQLAAEAAASGEPGAFDEGEAEVASVERLTGITTKNEDFRTLGIVMRITVVICVTYYTCVAFASAYTEIKDDQLRIVVSLVFMHVLMPIMEKLMQVTVRAMEFQPGGLIMRMLAKFITDLFFFVFYRLVIQIRYRTIVTFVLVEVQHIVTEIARYPLFVTDWYREREDKLRARVGRFPQIKIVSLGLGLLAIALVLITFFGDNGLFLAGAYAISLPSAVVIRVGMNFSHEIPLRSDYEGDDSEDIDEAVERGEASGAKSPSMELENLSADDAVSDSGVVSEVRNMDVESGVRQGSRARSSASRTRHRRSHARSRSRARRMRMSRVRSDETTAPSRSGHQRHMSTMGGHGYAELLREALDQINAEAAEVEETQGTEAAIVESRKVSEVEEINRIVSRRGTSVSTIEEDGPDEVDFEEDAEAAYQADLLDFQRSFATEHFYRKRARQLALFAYALYLPWLYRGYNKEFYPFNDTEEVGSHSFDNVLIFGAIMLFFDMCEATYARVTFNKTVKMDTFSDAVVLLRSGKCLYAFLFSAVHILSDVFIALNLFRFCDDMI